VGRPEMRDGDTSSSRKDVPGESLQSIIERRLSRRAALKAGITIGAVAVVGPALSVFDRAMAAEPEQGLRFTAIPPDTGDQIVVPDGYRHQVIHRWGDPVFANSPAFDVDAQSPGAQELQAGFNHDFTYFLPLPMGSANSDDGLLWTNHEYTDGATMFRGYDAANPTRDQVEIELAAHGATISRIKRAADGSWVFDRSSRYNRRVTGTTRMRVTGPAAGIELLRTDADPSGRMVFGMLNNCGGGVTPWGTVLTCEENFNQYFANAGLLAASDARKASHLRYGIPQGPASASGSTSWSASTSAVTPTSRSASVGSSRSTLTRPGAFR
jgi:secreted PhoX family phosphatase